ncbi:MAG: hypothetical protein LBT41_02415 [Candidatus Methanoplasma sp.]|jgi:hypothetical protein|nr:hypothetical protein [Candidatus Methanoplasma sp.]
MSLKLESTKGRLAAGVAVLAAAAFIIAAVSGAWAQAVPPVSDGGDYATGTVFSYKLSGESHDGTPVYSWGTIEITDQNSEKYDLEQTLNVRFLGKQAPEVIPPAAYFTLDKTTGSPAGFAYTGTEVINTVDGEKTLAVWSSELYGCGSTPEDSFHSIETYYTDPDSGLIYRYVSDTRGSPGHDVRALVQADLTHIGTELWVQQDP